MKGLAPKVSKLFDDVSRLECIKPFVLVGGTALSLQIKTRLSEDLDFMRWKIDKNDKLEIGWHRIKAELQKIGTIQNEDILGFDHAIFVVNGVKLSFYAAPRKRIPTMEEIPICNNLRVADIKSIGAMKMETMSRRSKFRDYYDIYSILKENIDFREMVSIALKHSGHTLKEKNLLAILGNGERFAKEKGFQELNPIYDVTPLEIQNLLLKEMDRKRALDTLEEIEKQLIATAATQESETGEMILCAAVGRDSYTSQLNPSEYNRIKDDKSALIELVLQKFRSEAIKNVEVQSNIDLHLLNT